MTPLTHKGPIYYFNLLEVSAGCSWVEDGQLQFVFWSYDKHLKRGKKQLKLKLQNYVIHVSMKPNRAVIEKERERKQKKKKKDWYYLLILLFILCVPVLGISQREVKLMCLA